MSINVIKDEHGFHFWSCSLFATIGLGILNDITIGLNWYLNPCTRVMFNYVMGTMEDHHSEETTENTFQCRMQIDF